MVAKVFRIVRLISVVAGVIGAIGEMRGMYDDRQRAFRVLSKLVRRIG